MADFNYHLNRQGPQGPQGETGPQGFSPSISVETNTAAVYQLRITNEDNYFITDNLRGSAVDDRGGTYMRYDPDTLEMFTGSLDHATTDSWGAVILADDEDVAGGSEGVVVTADQLYETNLIVDEHSSTLVSMQTEIDDIEASIPDVSAFLTEADVAEVAITGSYNDLLNKPTIPAPANNGILTITQGGVTIGTFGADSSTNVTVDIPVPTTITVDTAMSSTSENPVQNKVIYNQLYLTSTAVSGLTGRVSTIENDYLTSFDKTSSVAQGNTKLPTSEAVYSAISTAVSDLPVATASTKGIVKPDDDTIIIDQYGTISVDTDELNKASTTNLGVVAVDGITITADAYGVISAAQPTYSTTVTSTDTTKAPTSAAVYDFVTTQVSQVTVDKATSTTLGTVMPDNSTIEVNANGVISTSTTIPTVTTMSTAISTATSTMVTSTTIRTMLPTTQSDYDDLVEGGTVDANTLYVITDAA